VSKFSKEMITLIQEKELAVLVSLINRLFFRICSIKQNFIRIIQLTELVFNALISVLICFNKIEEANSAVLKKKRL
jgi:hypothetical protein